MDKCSSQVEWSLSSKMLPPTWLPWHCQSGVAPFFRCKLRGIWYMKSTAVLWWQRQVSPSKITSIPKLELAAVVVSAKTSVMLKGELDMKIDREFFWTDSQVVLGYINHNACSFHIFVANCDANQWHYLSTSENPAVHSTRGFRASDINSMNWLWCLMPFMYYSS